MQFGGRAFRSQRLQPGKIASIHRHDQLEVMEVVRLDLTRALPRDVDAFCCRNLDRPAVRRVADMPGAGPRRSDHRRLSGSCREVAVDSFRKW